MPESCVIGIPAQAGTRDKLKCTKVGPLVFTRLTTFVRVICLGIYQQALGVFFGDLYSTVYCVARL